MPRAGDVRDGRRHADDGERVADGRGIETKLVVGEAAPVPDTTLIRALLDSHREMASRRAGRRRPDAPAPTGSRARRRSYLAFLSPSIQQSILDGTVPEGLTLERLLGLDIAMDWTTQERMLGFSTVWDDG